MSRAPLLWRAAVEHNSQNTFIKNSCTGLSLIETLCTLAILSILVATAAPNLAIFSANTELRTTTQELKNSLSLARQYAITNASIIHICAINSQDQNKCKDNTQFNSNWSNGWIVYSDDNANNQYDDSDTLIQKNTNNKRIAIVFNQRGRLRFFPDGSSRSAGFYLCNANITETNHIRLLFSGRSRVAKTGNERHQIICNSTIEKNI